MKRFNVNNIISTSCFSLFNLLFLLNHFSLWGCVYVALTTAYYIVRINIVGRKRENFGLTEWLGVYVGAMFADFIIVYGLEQNVFESIPYINDTLISNIVTTVIIALIVVPFIELFNRFGKTINRAGFYIKNILLCIFSIVVPCFYIDWQSVQYIVLFVLVIIATGIYIDIINRKNEETTYGFSAAKTILVLFMFCSVFYTEFAIKIVGIFYNLPALSLSPWYYYAGAELLLFGGVLCSYIWSYESCDISKDVKVYIAMIFAIPAYIIFTSFYTSFTVIFVLIYAFVNIVFLFPIKQDRFLTLFGYKFSIASVKYLSVLSLSMLLPVSFYYGWLLQMSCVFIATIVICAMESSYSSKTEAKFAMLNSKTFWHFIVISLAVFSICRLYLNGGNWRSYTAVSISVIIATIALIALNQKNRLKKSGHIIMKSLTCVSILVFMIFISGKTVIDVNTLRTETKSGVRYSVKIDSPDNFCSGKYYWLGESEQYFEFINEIEITLPQQNGIVCFEVQLEDGTEVYFTKCFFDRTQYCNIKVGMPIIELVQRDNRSESSFTETDNENVSKTVEETSEYDYYDEYSNPSQDISS